MCHFLRIADLRLALYILVLSCAASLDADEPRLRPWAENRWYWSFDGEPVLLLGGSDDDNLFQWPADQLIPQLDRIESAGGNVVRNTMSDRPDRGFELYPFLRLEDGRYDLERWNDEYWDRFDRFLEETAKRKIFVQLEVWDRFDFTDQGDSDRWQRHPYHPANNINYDFESSGFAERYPDHPGTNRQPFFYTTPAQRNNTTVLRYQQRFVDRLLETSLRYDHVLYCMDNETSGDPAWGAFWAKHIKQRAAEVGRKVQVTEMWDDWDLLGEQHRHTMDHPELYDFVDVSQNNQNSGRKHWERFLAVRKRLADHPRPMNTTKTYGADGNKFGHSDQDGVERFWRHLLAGAASMRFHRPDSGLGINDRAVAAIRAARKLEAIVPLWKVDPDESRLSKVDGDEAYLASNPGQAYVLFFPRREESVDGVVALDLTELFGKAEIQWVSIDTGELGPRLSLTGESVISLTAPDAGNWVATITPSP